MATEQKAAQSHRSGATLQRWVTNIHTSVYRWTGGSIGGHMGKSPVLLLTTIGRKSGVARTTPLIYLADGTRIILVASNGGAQKHPLWWRNLLANPRAEVEVGRQHLHMTARQATPEERTQLWPRLVATYGPYEDYQKRTTREIPIVILEREGIMLRDNGIITA